MFDLTYTETAFSTENRQKNDKMSKISFFSQSNVFNFSEVYFYNYPFSKLFLYKEPWFLKEIATPLRGITTFFGTCATLRKKSFGKNLRITIKVHEKKKMII